MAKKSNANPNLEHKDELKIIREESGEQDTSLIQDALKDDRVVKQLAELAVSEPEAVST